MIPLIIKLKNFLSYGAELQTIDFSPYPLICLSGKNGHGKSALLDAITWAIWGQARKESGAQRAEQGLIRLGQTNMLVILDFSCNGQVYRVRREYIKTATKQYVTLDFGMVNPEKETCMSLTEKTSRATQNIIERILNLSFESFVNSAFLRQGNAHEFSRKTPRERKHILAAILGINRYDTLKLLALEKIKQATIQQATLAALQANATQELDTTASITDTIKELEYNLTSVQNEEKAHNKQLQTIAQEYTTYMQKQQEYLLLKAQLEQCSHEEHHLLEKLRALRREWQTVHRQLLCVPDNAHLEKKKQQLSKELTHHQHLFAQQLTLKESLLHTKEKLQKKEHELNNAAQIIRIEKQTQLQQLRAQEQINKQTLQQLHAAIATYTQEYKTLRKNHATMQDRLTSIAKKLAHMQPEEKQFEKRKEYYQRFIEQGNACHRELELLQQKKHLVQDKDNPSCPLCEQNLSASRKRFLKKTFDEQESFLIHRINRLARVVKELKHLLIEQHATLEHGKSMRQEQAQLIVMSQERAINITKYEDQQKKSLQELENLEKNLAQIIANQQIIQKELEDLYTQEIHIKKTDLTYSQLQQTCITIDKQTHKLGYNTQAHEQTAQELLALEKLVLAHKTIQDQKPLQEQRTHEIAAIITSIKALRKRAYEFTQRCAPYASLPAHLQELTQQQETCELQRKKGIQQKEILLREKGKVEHAQEKRKQLEKTMDDYTAQDKALVETIEDYSIIATATGKDGIQALLIDEALPEIEHETNILLAKLTNNQTHLCIESLRDLKKGGTRETLDIKISDPAGIRTYELFSGGEAFRIDFALRIAIAKLLARRAGTALQTLIIDEGFGSQDEEGLGHIMDAVYKIQNDFAKIIIVSHLSSMKDQFPVHFFIEKTLSGSHATIREQE